MYVITDSSPIKLEYRILHHRARQPPLPNTSPNALSLPFLILLHRQRHHQQTLLLILSQLILKLHSPLHDPIMFLRSFLHVQPCNLFSFLARLTSQSMPISLPNQVSKPRHRSKERGAKFRLLFYGDAGVVDYAGDGAAVVREGCGADFLFWEGGEEGEVGCADCLSLEVVEGGCVGRWGGRDGAGSVEGGAEYDVEGLGECWWLRGLSWWGVLRWCCWYCGGMGETAWWAGALVVEGDDVTVFGHVGPDLIFVFHDNFFGVRERIMLLSNKFENSRFAILPL